MSLIGRIAVAALLLGAAQPAAAQRAADPTLNELVAQAASDSNAPEAHYALAMGYWKAKRWDDAGRELKVTVSIDPADAEAWLAQWGLFVARGWKYWKGQIKARGIDSVYAEFQAARRREHRAFLIDPMVDLAALGLSDFKEDPRIVLKDGDLVPQYSAWWVPDLQWSIIDMQNGEHPVAEHRLQRIINDRRIGSDSSAPDVILWYHGLAAAHSGDFDAAVRDFYLLTGHANADLAEGDDSGLGYSVNELRYILATVLYHGGRFGEAVGQYRKVVETDLGFYMAHTQLARIYSAAGKWDDAVAERQAAVDAFPENPTLLIELGATLLKAGRPADAIEPLEEGGRLNPRDPLAPYLLGQALDKLGRAEDARTAFSRFLAIAPASYASQASEVRDRLAQ